MADEVSVDVADLMAKMTEAAEKRIAEDTEGVDAK